MLPHLTVRSSPLSHIRGQVSIPASAQNPPASAGSPAPLSEKEVSPYPSGYYLGGELDRRPVPLSVIEPEYPNDWRLVVLSTYKVPVRVFINESGAVDHVFTQNNPNGAFEKSALTAFAKARFSPGILRGSPVKSQMMVEIEFDPNGPAERSNPVAATASDRGK
jgi:periplasmic protein TonB